MIEEFRNKYGQDILHLLCDCINDDTKTKQIVKEVTTNVITRLSCILFFNIQFHCYSCNELELD